MSSMDNAMQPLNAKSLLLLAGKITKIEVSVKDDSVRDILRNVLLISQHQRSIFI